MNSHVRRLLSYVVFAVLASVPAAFISVLIYMLVASIQAPWPRELPLAFAATLMLLPRAAVIAAAVGVSLIPLRQVYQRVAFVLLPAMIGGLLFGLSAAGDSPHVSRVVAVESSVVVWGAVSLISVLVARRFARAA